MKRKRHHKGESIIGNNKKQESVESRDRSNPVGIWHKEFFLILKYVFYFDLSNNIEYK